MISISFYLTSQLTPALSDVAALCGNYQLLMSMLKWQNDTQMFLKLTDMTHGTIYCPITLKLRDKTPLRAALSGDAIVHCIQWLF